MAAATMSACGSRAHFCSRSTAQRGRGSGRPAPVSVRASLCSSQFHLTSWDSCLETSSSLREALPTACGTTGVPRREVVRMGNKGTGGPFAPLVVVTRRIVGEKDFNKFRGKAISYHSQIIKEFCKVVGADGKQCQGVIRLAKKNGEWLGFLA